MDRKTTILALTGKGGVGKTSLSAAIIRLLVEEKPEARILAIDADPAVGLATALGVQVTETLDDIRLRVAKDVTEGLSETQDILAEARFRIFEAMEEKNGFAFLAIGRPEAAGCYCAINTYLRQVIGLLAGEFDYVVIDGEAGIEQINRRVMERVTHLLCVSDQSRKGISIIETTLKGYENQKVEIETKMPAVVSSNIEKGRKMLQDIANALSVRRGWDSEKAKAEKAVVACTTSIEHYEKSVGDLDDKTTVQMSIDELTKQAAELSDGISRFDQLSAEIAALDGAITTTDEQIKASEQYIADLKIKKDGSTELRMKINVLSQVRQALHYSAIPRTLSQKIVKKLTAEVNNYLELFSAPFTVEPSREGIGFLCRFNDGRVMPDDLPDASFLSGGQKVQLAVAFRFATYEMFASKLGLLVLDEPTAYLDEQTINKFGGVLKKIMDVAKTMNVQVLCATHHSQVSAQADQIIQL